MSDAVDDLFDPNVPIRDLRPSFGAVNPAKARRRVAQLLRTQPLAGDRVFALVLLLQHLQPERMLDAVRGMCSAFSVPVMNRAALAYVLMSEDLDPGVPPDQLPALAESLLVGGAAVGDLARVPAVLAAIAALPAVDIDELIESIEKWRFPCVVPGDLVYCEVLVARACARAHAAVLAVLERDARTDTLVRGASDAGALDPELAAAFLSSPGAPRPPLVGSAWADEQYDPDHGRIVRVAIAVDDAVSTFVELALSSERVVCRDLQPLLPHETVAEMVRGSSDLDAWIRVPLEAVAATAASAVWDVGSGRAQWLLGAVPPSDGSLDDAILAAMADPERARHALEVVAGAPSTKELHWAVARVKDAFEAGVYSSAEAPVWRDLLVGVADALERRPIRWLEGVDKTLTWAWSELVATAEAVADERLPLARRDRLAWREVLAVFVDDIHRYGGGDLFNVVDDHRDALARLGVTAGDLAREVDAPGEVAILMAEGFGVGVDDPLVHGP